MELVTKRLVLREYAATDLEAVHRFASDPQASRFVEWGPNSPRDTRAFLEECLAEQAESPRTRYSLAVTESGSEPFGSVGIYRSGTSAAEIGFVISPERWGSGFATEAAEAVLHLGFAELGLHRVWATCRPHNLASARVLERIGMEREGRLRDHVCIRGRWEDSLLYAAISPLSPS